MKHVAGALIVFAWLVTTDKIVELRQVSSSVYSVVYEVYCTTQKSIVADNKGRYKLDLPAGVVYVPVNGSKISEAAKCQ